MATYLIIGASRGLGALMSRELPHPGDTVWLVSRSQPDLWDDGVQRHWVRADLAQSGVSTAIAKQLGTASLDVCVYNAGIWEPDAFTEAYNFEQVTDDETERIVAVNLTAAITTVQKLLPHLRRSVNGRVVFIGSHSGLDNAGHLEVANTATKFGLRGVTHALRSVLRKDRIAVTCVNLGNVGVITYKGGVMQLEETGPAGAAIPPADLIAVLRCVTQLSRGTLIKELDLAAIHDRV